MANMKKSVFSVEMECDKCKKDALQCIARVEGVDMVKIDLEKKTITVEGESDPASITNQLRVKFKSARLVSTGPLPPPQQPKKDDDKKKTTQADKSQEKPKNEKGSTQQKEANGAKKQKDTQKENPGESKDKEQTTQKDGTKDDKQSKEKSKQKETTNKTKEVENPPKQEEQQIRFFPTYPPCVVHYPCPPVSHCRCSDCSCRSDMLWPRYQPPAPRTEVWYVTNEETPSSCTIS